MMKVGIITFFCSYNYGSALQAYALQYFLNKSGCDVNIIDYTYTYDFRQYYLFRTHEYLKRPQAMVADILCFSKNKKRKIAFEDFVNKYFTLTKRYSDNDDMTELNKDFDAFICGSDQIWNLDCTNGVVPAYFLGFVDDNKNKIAYAPSVAKTKFIRNHDKEVQRYINRLDAISVREKSTVGVFQKVCSKEIKVTVDPTLLLTGTDYDKLLSSGNTKNKNYIFVYMLSKDERLLNYVSNVAKTMKKEIVYITGKLNRSFGCKAYNVYGCGPEEFLSYIKNADYVITNSFHATVFSVQFHKKFCVFPTKNGGARMIDLLTEIGLEQCIYNSNINIEQDINYEEVEIKLSGLRESSIEFLRSALSDRK